VPLNAWENFYVIVGSAAGALTGLQFVVIALITQSRRRTTGREIAAFASPNVVHFCSALFVSAALSAPWRSLEAAAIPLVGCGLAGAVYTIIVAQRARKLDRYKPVFEDWLWHVALPFSAYLAMFIAAMALPRGTSTSLFATAAATLLLVFIGIHNAWDAVVYLTTLEDQHNK
jgi:hypothetical protein